MNITRISPISGEQNSMELDITAEQIQAMQDGKHIQDVLPHLTADEREFILTGITAKEWDELFKKEDEDE